MKGYKTLVTNGLLAIFSAIEFGTGEVIAVDDTTAAIAGILALINIGLRFVTTSAVGEK